MRKTDPRIIKTLRSIDQALLTLLKEYPFQKITIEMICTTALINRSTFYKYYDDKYALLDDYLGRTLSDFRDTVKTNFILAEPFQVDDPVYQNLFRQTMDYLYDNRERYRILWKASFGRNIYAEMIEIVIGCIKKDMDMQTECAHRKELYATLFASDMMTIIRWWFAHEDKVTKEDVVSIMTSNMRKGMFYTFKRV